MPEPDKSPEPSQRLADWSTLHRQQEASTAQWEQTTAMLKGMDPQAMQDHVKANLKDPTWFGWDIVTKAPWNGAANAVGSTYNFFLGNRGPLPRYTKWNPAGQPTSISGGLFQGLVQFGAGYATGGKAMKTGRSAIKAINAKRVAKAEKVKGTKKGGKKLDDQKPSGRRDSLIAAATGLGKGAISDFIAFDPGDQGGLGNFLLEAGKENGWDLANPNFYKWVEDWTAVDPKDYAKDAVAIDTDFKNRLKEVGIGMGLGLGFESFFRLFKWSKYKSLENEYGKDMQRLQEALENEAKGIDIARATATPEQAKELKRIAKELVTARARYRDTLLKANKEGFLVDAIAKRYGGKESAGFISNSGWLSRSPEGGAFPFASESADAIRLTRFDVDTKGFLKDIGKNLQETHNLKLRVGVPDAPPARPRKKARGAKAKKEAAELAEIRKGRVAVDLLPAESKDSAGTIFLNPDILDNLWKQQAGGGSQPLKDIVKDIDGYGDTVFKDKDEFVDFLIQRKLFEALHKGGKKKKALTPTELDTLALNRIKTRRDGMGGYLHTTSKIWKDDMIPVDFSKSAGALHRSKLYEIDPDSGKILMDYPAVYRDWKKGMPYLKGKGRDPMGGGLDDISPASANELDILSNLGIDPIKLYNKFLDVGGKEGGAEVYGKFLELRARHLIQIAEKRGIKNLNDLSVHDIRTRDIFTEATFKALGNSKAQGGLGLGIVPSKGKPSTKVNIDNLKSEGISSVNPEGLAVQPSKVHEFLWEKGGLDKLKVTLDKVARGEIPLSDLNAHGHFSPIPKDGSVTLKSDTMLLGLIKTLEGEFDRVIPDGKSFDSLARGYGWKSAADDGKSAQLFFVEKMEEELETFAKAYNITDINKLKKMMAEGEGSYAARQGEELKVINLPEDMSLANLSPAELWSMKTRITATRELIYSHVGNMNRMIEAMEKGAEAGTKVSNFDKFHFTMEVMRFLDDTQDFAAFRTLQGRGLQVLNDAKRLAAANDKLFSKEASEQQYGEILEQLEKQTGVSVAELVEVVRLQKNDLTLTGLSRIDVAGKMSHNLGRMGGATNLVAAFNEIYINSLLSSVTTQVVNVSSNIAFGYASAIEGYLGSYIPTFLYKNKYTPDLKNWVDQNEIPPRVAAVMVRDKNWRKLVHMTYMNLDMLNILTKSAKQKAFGGDSTLYFTKDAALGSQRRMNESVESWQRAWESEGGQAPMMGGSPWDNRELGDASAENISAGLKGILGETTHGALSKAVNYPFAKIGQALDLEDGGEFLGQLWNGAMKSIVHQPMRKMNLMDQLAKRIHLSSYFEGSLWAHAKLPREHGGLGLTDADEIGTWIAHVKPHLMLSNGNPFSEKGLKEIIRRRGINLKYKDEQLEKYVLDQWDAHKHARDSEGNIFLTAEQREKLASDNGLGEADRHTFTEDLDRPRSVIHANKVREANKAGEETPPKMRTGVAKWISGGIGSKDSIWGPLARQHLPFMKTPTHLVREFLSRFPALGLWHQNMRAARVSGNPDEIAQSYGKQLTGVALWSAACAAAYSGRLTGSLNYGESRLMPRDKAMTQRLAGRRRYTFRVGDKLVDFSRMEPFAFHFKVAADFHDLWHIVRNDATKRSLLTDIGIVSTTAIASATLNSTWTQGAANMTKAIMAASSDPEQLMQIYGKIINGVHPRILKEAMGSMDTLERDYRSFMDRELKIFFPYGVSPMRDPILGRVIQESPWQPNRFVQMFNPMPIYDAQVHSLVYSELASINTSIGPMASEFHGQEDLQMGNAWAEFGGATLNDRRIKEFRAKNFTLPANRGGAKCPIARGQSFYDFNMQYQSLRKVPKSEVNLTKYDSFVQASEYPEEMKADMKPFLEAVEKSIKSRKKKYLGLEEILYLAITVDSDGNGIRDFEDLAKEPRGNGQPSLRQQVLQLITQKWRQDSTDELKGQLVPMKVGMNLPPVLRYNGVIADFWHDLASGVAAFEIEHKWTSVKGASGKLRYNRMQEVVDKRKVEGGGVDFDSQKHALEAIEELEKQNK